MKFRLSSAAACTLLLSGLAGSQNRQAEQAAPFEGTSLLGNRLYGLSDDGSIKAAQQGLAADPKNLQLILKLSKTQAARRQYREAVSTCTRGLEFAPRDADLFLERGHRELGLRLFKSAAGDLQRAVELDSKLLDAQYHLGMAQYFLRQFALAAHSFRRALDLAKTSDSVIDCSNWLYVSLQRAGEDEEARQVLTRITPEMKNQEPHLYFYLRLLRFYQGKLSESEVLPPKPEGPADIEGELSFNTVSYGVGNWHLYAKHDQAKASQLFQSVVKGHAWNSWGFIGSELELAEGK